MLEVSPDAMHSVMLLVLIIAASVSTVSTARDQPTTAPATQTSTEPTVVPPYPLTTIFRAFGPCEKGRRVHGAIDIGGVGPDAGLGTPIVSMIRSTVVRVGRSKKAPWRYGYPDRRKRPIKRGSWLELPRSAEIDGYGTVHFFTRTRGSWRTGNLIIARGLDPPLEGHTIRYMHLGAIHPDVKAGATLEAGQEIGLMGGTAVQESSPHLHLDVTRPDGTRVDLMHLFGLTEKPNRHCLKPRKARRG